MKNAGPLTGRKPRIIFHLFSFIRTYLEVKYMSEKKRQKKDGEDKNKNNRRMREATDKANKEGRRQQASQDEINRNPNYK
jgi:hypothetical protein